MCFSPLIIILFLQKRDYLSELDRVLGRYFYLHKIKGIRGKETFRKLANQITNLRKCKELNWSILDFGALVCKSIKPRGTDCVLNSRCVYYSRI